MSDATAVYSEDDLVPLSALQHMHYCARQCALIHVERIWVENRYTAEGRVMHKRVHGRSRERDGDVRIVRSLRLRSLALGLSGVTDVVQFHPAEEDDHKPAENVPGLAGRWRVYPVEYKRGKRKRGACDRIQLCAQALCLEEMLDCQIPVGALFYGKTRRRNVVPLDVELRELTKETAKQVHEMIGSGRTPPPEKGPKCKLCSLAEQCMPDLPPGRSAKEYLDRRLGEILES